MATPDEELPLNRDFYRLWSAQTISGFGARITREALPLAAVLTLGAQPAQLGLLASVVSTPQILMGLTAGGFVDRNSRRAILIGSDVFRGLVLLSVPLAAWLHLLSMLQIYAVGLLIGSASVITDLAGHAFLPSMLGPELLAKGNTRLSITDSLAEIAGPAVSGGLVQLLTAPIAIGLDVVTYVVSAVLMLTVKEPSAPERERGLRPSWRRDFTDALRTIAHDPLIRPVFLMDFTGVLFGTMLGAVYLFFAAKQLHMSPAMIGLSFAAGGLGGLLGAVWRSRITRAFGFGATVLIAAFTGGACNLIIPSVHGSPWIATAILSATRLVTSILAVLAGVSLNTLRQTVVPIGLLGRVAAAFQVGTGIAAVIGGLAGGLLGQTIGTRETMVIAAFGLFATGLWGAFSPLRRLKVMPSPQSQRAAEGGRATQDECTV